MNVQDYAGNMHGLFFCENNWQVQNSDKNRRSQVDSPQNFHIKQLDGCNRFVLPDQVILGKAKLSLTPLDPAKLI